METSPVSTPYDELGIAYSGQRQTDPHIARYIHAALGDAQTVLNVGAGTGSYEPTDRYVVAVEPSAVMRSQRKGVPAIIGTAGNLPFDDNAFDASMAMLTIHHWLDPAAGLRELRRVTKGPVVIFTYDPQSLGDFWFFDYAPEMLEQDKVRFPEIDRIAGLLGEASTVQSIPVTMDCKDGFLEAFYGRPESFLDPVVRQSQSVWALQPQDVQDKIVNAIEQDLQSGEWDRKYGRFRTMPSITCGLRLVIGKRP